MKNDHFAGLKRKSFAIALIVLGALIFFWTRDYKQVPSGIGPAFFPRIVATMLIVLSAICVLMPEKGESTEAQTDRGAAKNIVITVVSLIVMVGIMKYLHPLLGIFLFLGMYLKVIAGLTWKKTGIITVIGTAVLYVAILTLRIPM